MSMVKHAISQAASKPSGFKCFDYDINTITRALALDSSTYIMQVSEKQFHGLILLPGEGGEGFGGGRGGRTEVGWGLSHPGACMMADFQGPDA